MKKDTEFQEFMKKLPYKTPDGFFEQVSEKTLLKAKHREQNRKKYLLIWRSVAVAASLVGIASFGYYMSESGTPQENIAVQVQHTDSILTILQKQENAIQPSVAEIKRAEPEKKIVNENDIEGIGDVLANLSDDELLQMAAMFKTDPFLEESPQ